MIFGRSSTLTTVNVESMNTKFGGQYPCMKYNYKSTIAFFHWIIYRQLILNFAKCLYFINKYIFLFIVRSLCVKQTFYTVRGRCKLSINIEVVARAVGIDKEKLIVDYINADPSARTGKPCLA